jgi:hypothetical protein
MYRETGRLVGNVCQQEPRRALPFFNGVRFVLLPLESLLVLMSGEIGHRTVSPRIRVRHGSISAAAHRSPARLLAHQLIYGKLH